MKKQEFNKKCEDLVAKIVTIIDEDCKYKVIRRPYDEAFAQAHDITLDDIQNARYIPCIECGNDITSRTITGKLTGKIPVYCSKQCRGRHGMQRVIKINDNTNINEYAERMIAKGLDIVLSESVARAKKGGGRTSLRSLALETNNLLREILKELRDANRGT